jgi:hypothetical protein
MHTSAQYEKLFMECLIAKFIMEKPSGNFGIDAIVVVPKEISADSDKMHKVIRVVDTKFFGCPACCSGKDILFKTEISFEKIRANIPKDTMVLSVTKDFEVNEMNI